MTGKVDAESMLSPYRVLDLADEKGLLCGKILGDLGADVIKIEKPGGDAARNQGPFYKDEPHPEKSLFWFAFNTSKRSITLDIDTSDGKEIFKKLLKNADFVIETFSPGYLDSLGLGYKELEKIKPDVIVVSITPFGQTGPYKNYKTSDIVAWGMGGEMAPFGDPDRPPVHFSYHSQAYLHAGIDGVQGALTALFHRWRTGEGQQVDVSVQESVVQCTEHITSGWDLRQQLQKRGEGGMGRGPRLTRLWPCKDGYVSWFFWGGPMSLRTNLPLVEWMNKEGWGDEYMKNYNWSKFGMGTTQEEIDRLEAPTAKFFLAHTKKELFEGALKNSVQLYAVSTPADMIDSPQLDAREFWQEVEHPGLGTIIYPGAFVNSSEAPPRISRPAPQIGEHNREIYEEELGISGEQLVALKQAGII